MDKKALLIEAWKSVFGVDSVEDNADFFEAGGDSIKAVQLSAWLIQKGVKLDLADIFSTPGLGDLAKTLKETKPLYVPDAMLTKDLVAKEMAGTPFEKIAEQQKAGQNTKQDSKQKGDQQVCTPQAGMGDQQVCTPQAGMGDQQVCTPQAGMGDQQVCTPQAGMGNQQVCTPQAGMGNQQVCTPQAGMGNQQVCTPQAGMGNQQVCTPQANTAPAGRSFGTGVPPQLEKYITKPADKPIEKPNVMKLEKVKVGVPTVSAEEALTIVLNGLLKDWNKKDDLFAQGLTSLDTVKIVTRCAENGYEVNMKDIYMHATFKELVKCMKPGK